MRAENAEIAPAEIAPGSVARKVSQPDDGSPKSGTRLNFKKELVVLLKPTVVQGEGEPIEQRGGVPLGILASPIRPGN